MLKMEDIAITEEFGNMTAPHQMRITHKPTGIVVMGNTGSENAKGRLRDDLLKKLEACLPDAEPTPAAPNDSQRQIDELKQMVANLIALQGSKVSKSVAKRIAVQKAPEAPKKRGRPKKVNTVTDADGNMAAGAEIHDAQFEITHPEGYSVLDPSKVQAPPMVSVTEHRSYKPGTTVAKVSDKAAAKGIVA